MVYDVIIIGSGPAGLTAGIYTGRASLKTLIIAGTTWGGQLMLTSVIENFPGFPEGIDGPLLMQNMRSQAEHHGVEIKDVPAVVIEGTLSPFTVKTETESFQTRAVVIASGADARWLDVPGEKERIGKGVSSCATCDAAFFRNKDVMIVGGGDSAMEEALVLAQVANRVTIVHRRDVFRASQIMQDKVHAHDKIAIKFNSEIAEIKGEGRVQSVMLRDTKTNETSEMPINGVFVAIGHIPNTKFLSGIDVDSEGYLITKEHMKTSVEGIFTAGDVHDTHYRQAITAAGYGCAAALEVERWLQFHE
jgi:thioredoxin reductase (NADPH)